MGALQNLVLSQHNQRSETAFNAIPKLVAMLKESPSEAEAEAAAGALRNLAMCDSNSERMAREGAVQPLVDMLSKASNLGKEIAAGDPSGLLSLPGHLHVFLGCM